jgi:hypothetical protein
MYLTFKKLLGSGAGLILAASWITYRLLVNTYVNYPRTPQGNGQVVPYVVKGVIVYITGGQEKFLNFLEWTEIVSGIVAVAVLMIHGGDPFKSIK